MSGRKKRRSYPLVDRSRQYRFLLMILIYNLAIVGFVALPLLAPDIAKLHDETLSLEVRALAAEKILTTHARLWPALVALVCLIGLHSFRMFHRFVGPLYRLREACEKIGGGDLGFRVKLRKGDYLMEEEKAINTMIETLAGKVQTIQERSKRAVDSMKEIERLVPTSGRGKDNSTPLSVHLSELQGLLEATGHFRTGVSRDEATADPITSS
jgi:methyl-accepting chemotaxis protein